MLIKKLIFVFFLVIYTPFFTVLPAFCAEIPEVSAKSAILINSQTNEILFEKNKDECLSMASTTKIMTSLLAIESGRLCCVVKAERDIVCEGTAINIKKGDSFTLETLVYSMLLESGNDAAILVAEYLAGSEKKFAELMNKKAKEIGMTSTNFVTSSGLDADEHYTTAHDMAILGSYAIKNPVFKKICSTESYTARYINPAIEVNYVNHNKLFYYYNGVIGIKTGFTKKSGRCLVSACEKDGVTLVAVTLNAGDDWNDHIAMFDFGFSAVKSQKTDILMPDEVNVYGSVINSVAISLKNKSISTDNVTYQIYLKKFYYAPIEKGDILGFAEIYTNGKAIERLMIYASENAENIQNENKPDFNFLYKLKQILFRNK